MPTEILPISPEKPFILNYLHVTEYLNGYFKYRKNKDTSFSYEIWSNELGFKSKSTTRMMTYGEIAITENFINSFSMFENLSIDEKNHLILISQYKNAKTDIEKSSFLDKILSKNDFTKNKMDIHDYAYFIESPLLPKIQLFISFTDIQATVENVSSAFDLTIDKTKMALQDLVNLNLAYTDDQIIWKSKVKHYKVDSKNTEYSRKIFHKNSIDRSLIALDQMLDLSIFKNISFSLNESELEDLKKDTAAFFNLLKNKYAKDSITDRRIYEISIHAKPISKKIKCQKTKPQN